MYSKKSTVLVSFGLLLALFLFALAPANAWAGCGNGILEAGEGCDDGNFDPGDGCNADCTPSFDMEVQPPILTYTNGYPRAMARTDLNNDGIQDLIVTSFRAAYLYTYLLDSTGSLTHVGTYQLGSNTRDVKTGNLNGDHFPDVVTTDLDTDELHIFFGNGDGSLTLANVFVPGDRLWLVDIGDIDNDGYDDLIVASMYTDGFKIYYGDGQGNFPRSDFIYTGGDPFAPLVMDFNHDGYSDLFLTVNYANSSQTYLGSPAGLVPGQNFGFAAANSIAIDLNQDGYDDVLSYGAVPDEYGTLVNGMHVMINQKDGTFVETQGIPSTAPGWVMDKADFNNDGIMDLVISTRANYVRLFLGNGQGSLEPEIQYPLPMSNDSTLVIDLNLDGLPDFLVSGYYNDAHREVWPVINHNQYQFPRCGDSRIESGENCDDGNAQDGDGCSSICRLEQTGDSDHDGLTDADETGVYLTDPMNPDTDGDCTLDGAEVQAGKNPLDPSDQPGCTAIVTPDGNWHLLVTLLKAPSNLLADLYLTSPRTEPLIKNSLKNVGKVAQTPVKTGDIVTFNLHVNASALGFGEYDYSSTSAFARVTRVNAFVYKVNFETLPISLANWDFQDLEVLVEFIAKTPAVGIHRNQFDEFTGVANGATADAVGVILPFDGYADVQVPAGALDSSSGVVLTAGLPDKYDSMWDPCLIEEYRKIILTNGQGRLSSDATVTIAYMDGDGDGVVDGSGFLEQEMIIYRFDPVTLGWVALPSTVDSDGNKVSAQTDEIGHSLFALGTSLCVPPPDQDGDGLSDGQEAALGTNPAKADSDNDGLADGAELAAGTNPLEWDSDGDSLPDGFESAPGLDPLSPADAAQDFDGDGNSNLDEYYNGTDIDSADPNGHADHPQLGCCYFGDADGDGLLSPMDLDAARNVILGMAQDYSHAIPPDGTTQDIDGIAGTGPADLSLLRDMLLGLHLSSISGRAGSITVIDAPAGTVAAGDTCRITALVENEAGTGAAHGFAVIFEVVSGNATLMGGDGTASFAATGNRYDFSGSSGNASIVVKANSAGTVVIDAYIPPCGVPGEGRACSEVGLSQPVTIVSQ